MLLEPRKSYQPISAIQKLQTACLPSLGRFPDDRDADSARFFAGSGRFFIGRSADPPTKIGGVVLLCTDWSTVRSVLLAALSESLSGSSSCSEKADRSGLDVLCLFGCAGGGVSSPFQGDQ